MSRVGIGYDIHRLKAGRRLVLGGVDVPSELGLDGHSDADVVLHALMDALLGAAGLADIGQHFPPDNEQFRDASSLDLLATVAEIIAAAGYQIGNVDIVVVAEKPAIAPHAGAMKSAIAQALHLQPSDVGLKATTNEGVGAEGRYEAISARAVALLVRRRDG